MPLSFEQSIEIQDVLERHSALSKADIHRAIESGLVEVRGDLNRLFFGGLELEFAYAMRKYRNTNEHELSAIPKKDWASMLLQIIHDIEYQFIVHADMQTLRQIQDLILAVLHMEDLRLVFQKKYAENGGESFPSLDDIAGIFCVSKKDLFAKMHRVDVTPWAFLPDITLFEILEHSSRYRDVTQRILNGQNSK